MDANKIIYYRKKKNLSRYRLAKKANIPESTLRDIEVKNTLNPRLNTILSLAKVLEVEITDLLKRDIKEHNS